MNNIVHELVKKIGETNPQFSSIELKKMEYGIICMLSDLTKVIIYFAIFYAFNLQKYFLVSYFFFSSIRIFCGGYHAKTYIGCLIISFIVFLIIIFMNLNCNLSTIESVILLSVSIVTIFIVSPVENINKKIKTEQRRRKLKYWSVATGLLLAGLCFFIPKEFIDIAVFSIVAAAFMAIVGKMHYAYFAKPQLK